MALVVKNKQRMVYDFGWARGDSGLRKMLESMDMNGYELICVTHVHADCYKIFFRRPVAMPERMISAKKQPPPLVEEHRLHDLHYYSSEDVLGYAEEERFVVVKYTESEDGDVAWVTEDGTEYGITHWMPLPEEPNPEA